MTHTYHDALDGFDERQILFDGCDECEQRGRDLRAAFAHMDNPTFARAWQRAYDINASGGREVGRESRAEAQLLHVLFAVQLRLVDYGHPLDGSIPRAT